MKISLCSDLHLDCGYQELPGGDLLILAGDICEVRDFRKEYHDTKLIDRKPGFYKIYDFFYHECAKYNHVIYIMGNHEHYGGKYHQTYDALKSYLPSNVKLMEDEYVIHDDVLFVCSTLWTDFNRGDPITLFDAKHHMNDYRKITTKYGSNGDNEYYHKMLPEYVYRVHRQSKKFITDCVEQYRDMKKVVVTHHAPSFQSIDPMYAGLHHMNGLYASELSNIMLDYSINYWVHGHTHTPVDYTVGTCRVISNPRGYVGYEDTSKFKPDFTFEL